MIYLVKFRVGFRALSADGTGSCPSDENRVLRSEIRIPLVHKEFLPPCAARSIREVFVLKKESYSFRSAKIITSGAMLTAACVVLAYIAKGVFGTGPFRFTVENLPVFVGSFFYGPIMGGAIAVTADLLSCVLAGQAPLPLISVGAAFVGVASGIVFKYILKGRNRWLNIIISVFSGHIVGSMILKSLALYPFYGEAAFMRIPVYVGIAVFESILLILFMRKKALVHQIEKTKD